MNLQKYKKKNKMALIAARVDADDLKVLKRKGFNISAIIQDAIKDAANSAKKMSDTVLVDV